MKLKMNRTHRALMMLVISICPALSFAQHTYTLDECQEMALQNNVRIKNADNALNAARLQK